jgi:hypothetical protein
VELLEKLLVAENCRIPSNNNRSSFGCVASAPAVNADGGDGVNAPSSSNINISTVPASDISMADADADAVNCGGGVDADVDGGNAAAAVVVVVDAPSSSNINISTVPASNISMADADAANGGGDFHDSDVGGMNLAAAFGGESSFQQIPASKSSPDHHHEIGPIQDMQDSLISHIKQYPR